MNENNYKYTKKAIVTWVLFIYFLLNVADHIVYQQDPSNFHLLVGIILSAIWIHEQSQN